MAGLEAFQVFSVTDIVIIPIDIQYIHINDIIHIINILIVV